MTILLLNLLIINKYMTEGQLRKSCSLPKLQNSSMKMSKLFKNSDTLMETKKIFLERLQAKQQNKNLDQNDKPNLIRPFIQLPKQMQQGFTSFKSINKSETQQIFIQLKKIRSNSTMLQPFIKAEIQFNKVEYEKIKQLNELKIKQGRDYMVKRIKQLTPNSMNKEVKIKEKFKNKIKNVKKINLKFNYKRYQQNMTCWKPYIDFDSMAVSIKQQIYFISGRKPCPIVVYNIIQQKWKQLEPIEGMKCFGETEPSVIDKKKLLCFGGYYYFQQGFSLIDNSLKIIDLKSLKMQVLEFSQTKTPCRSFHSQCIYGKFLIVSGGVDKNSKLFNNFMNFNFQKKYWNQITINSMPDRLNNGFAKHQTLSIFHSRQNYSIYDQEPIASKDQNIKEQGIYIFGGEDSNAELLSNMYIMRLGQPSIIIQQLNISGVAPVARRNAKMIRHKQYIIIHGGKNDEMKPAVLNSMHFLNLRTLNWIKVGGQKPPYRYSHGLTIVNDEIVILGGKGLQGLCKEIYIMPYQQVFQYI